MRKLLAFTFLLCCSFCALAQQPSAAPTGKSNWARVQALPPGATVKVHAATTTACKVQSVSEDAITCAAGPTIARADVKKITVSHRLRSTLVGAGAGVAVGAIIGVATYGSSNNNNSNFNLNIFSRGDLAAIFGVALGVLGAIVGVATDFTGSTLYSRP